MNKDSAFAKGIKWLRSHPFISGLLAMAVVVCALLWGILIFLDFWTHHGDDSIVPEIRQLSFDQARRTLSDASLDIEISDSIYDTSIPPGTIVESWPKPGSSVKRGRKIYVTLTAFTPKHVTLSMPVTGVSSRQAVSYLNALGINSVRIVDVPSQFPDLVEAARVGDRPLGVGSVIPVDASVVLEVGRLVATEDSDSDYTDDYESAIYNSDTAPDQSVYIDDEP